MMISRRTFLASGASALALSSAFAIPRPVVAGPLGDAFRAQRAMHNLTGRRGRTRFVHPSCRPYSEECDPIEKVGLFSNHRGGAPSGGGGGGTLPSHDFNYTATTVAQAPYTFGQGFQMGAVPSGHYPVPQMGGSDLVYQLDDIGVAWPDGSMNHCAVTVFVPAGTSGSNARITFRLATGTYSPASAPRSINDLTTGHNFLVHYKNVLTSPTQLTVPVTWTAVGSGNWTAHLSSFISANQFRITSNGPVKMTAYVYGFLTDDVGGAVSPTIYCESDIDVYTDPSNSANVLYLEHMHEISQPFINPTGVSSVDVMVGTASLYDGATKLRDYADDFFFLSASNVQVTSGGTDSTIAAFNLTGVSRVLQPSEVYQVNVNGGGTLPGGMSDGMQIFPYVHYNVQTNLWSYWNYNNTGQGAPGDPWVFNPTSAGSGTNSMKWTSRQFMAYYNGFFIAANDNGDPVLQAGTWATPARFLPNLDGTTGSTSTASQKAYLQAAGFVPGWDITLGSTCQSFDGANYSATEGPNYRTSTNGPMRTAVDAGGADFDTDFFLPEWDARWFVRMGASNWSLTDHKYGWVAALATAALPVTQQMRAPVGTNPPYILPFDNGPNNAGASYSGLGSPCPDDLTVLWGRFFTNTDSGALQPVGAAAQNQPFWFNGCYLVQATDYHWPTTCLLQYIIFGKRYLLRQLRRTANRSLSAILSEGIESDREWLSDGAFKFYGIQIPSVGASQEVFGMVAACSVLGNSSDPEIAYFANVVDQNYKFNNYFYGTGRTGTSYKPTQTVQSGWAGYANDLGFNSVYMVPAICYARNMTRHPLSRLPCDRTATMYGGMCDGSWGIGVYWAGGYERAMAPYAFFPGSPPAAGPGGVTSGPGTNWGWLDFRGPATFSVDSSGLWTGPGWNVGPGLGNGTIIWMWSQAVNGTYDTPPEYGPSAGYVSGTPFYVCQWNSGASTFRLTPTAGDPTGVHAITAATPASGLYLVVHPISDTPGDYFGKGSGTSDYALYHQALAELVRTGASAFSPVNVNTAYSTCHARFDPGTDYTSIGSPFTRISSTTAVPITPSIPY